ncbi:efflux RND transporter periplasmic adaptor subunit [Massilia sp. LjRoot122]|uniref:efflux RND transporter periplasmic adaptor subunit n=1 Tax=Massilia sp. LjRoot122 TaxID=3342257 RepID=UPI003ECF6FFD
MKRPLATKILFLALAGGLIGYGGYWLGANSSAGTAAPTDPGKRVLYWHDPMVPGKRFDKPGKSPFMDMQLVPVYAGEGESAGVRISPTLQQNLGVRFATVRREEVADALALVGTTQFDARREALIQSRTAGYIDRLHVRAPLQTVRRGQPVASVFVPEWIAPQEEYLALKRGGDTALASAARQRMRALSIPDSLVTQLERSGRVQTHQLLASPVSGIVSELGVREGAQVTPGMTIAKVVGLQTVWLLAELPEALIGAARIGMRVSATADGHAGRTYEGKVREILPGVNAATRTAQARIELDNRDAALMPGMLMRVRLSAAAAQPRLMVPTEAVIASGKRSVVLVAQGDSVRPVVVSTGREIGDATEILSGLEEGQKVVASGQFLIDSEASLKSVLPKFSGEASAPPDKPGKAAATVHTAVGKVEQVSDDAITLTHGPVATLQWPSMTMDFMKPTPAAFKDIKAGQTVEFDFVEGTDGYVLKRVVAAGGGKP